MSSIANIMELAKRLCLSHLAKRNIKQLETATEGELNFLERVLKEEIWQRGEKRKETILIRSSLPEKKTFEEFDIIFQPSITKWHFTKLKDTEWIDNHFNIVIVGDAGTGKSHIATAIGYAAMENQKKVFYATLKELIFLNNSKELIKMSKTKTAYIKECELLIIDEFGYTPITKEEALWLYTLLNDINRYTSIVIVTNRAFSKWTDIFLDEVLAGTLIDRITEKCQMIKLTGNSYRLAKHENIVKKKQL